MECDPVDAVEDRPRPWAMAWSSLTTTSRFSPFRSIQRPRSFRDGGRSAGDCGGRSKTTSDDWYRWLPKTASAATRAADHFWGVRPLEAFSMRTILVGCSLALVLGPAWCRGGEIEPAVPDIVAADLEIGQVLQSDEPRQARPAHRELTITHRYLHLPVRTGAAKARMKLSVEGELLREFEIELAEGKPDFWVFTDLEPYRGKMLRIDLDELAPDSRGLAAHHRR